MGPLKFKQCGLLIELKLCRQTPWLPTVLSAIDGFVDVFARFVRLIRVSKLPPVVLSRTLIPSLHEQPVVFGCHSDDDSVIDSHITTQK